MKLKYDKLFSAICLLAVVVLFVNTGSIRDLASSSDPGARLLPYIGEAILGICALIILVSKSDAQSFLDKAGWIKLVIILACMALYIVGLNYLGFLISTPIAIAVFIYLLKEDEKVNPIVALLMIVLLTVGLYFMFTKGFSILLPKGSLF
ncbi:tripartite tricarboxylate transporter TctB family protein [Intestinimonas massiliensis (ex Afouda et al. 2020)]|uniref:tripartite tricarboxylate transporter TctB family protein n=1 Tax=Intestinimonas massiliensis (ex Afouda et al. 2020) TaxID=1673721 RepID=UPI001031AAB5|nr:tripartite tricarboxylate transporter TctB family protein [Intestinimonas massiliensis (ex Afouda et al. 2020)]